MAVELDHSVRSGDPQLRTREIIVLRSVYMVGHPRGSCVVYPLLSLKVATAGKYMKSFDACHPYANNTHEMPKSAPQAVLSIMQLALRATREKRHGASALVASNVCLVGEDRTFSVPAFFWHARAFGPVRTTAALGVMITHPDHHPALAE